MDLKKFLNILPVMLCFIGLAFGNFAQSQTVVQWYTSMGDFRVQLREDLVPNTAQNFIDLTEDEFYDDLIFHRVIIEFMIQDGCPYGNGSGGPGYTFDDEFHPDLRHDEPGILSMANSGPNTNGSQYFITVVPTDWLDDVHSVFGKVMDGLDVVFAISEVDTDGNDKPIVDVVIDSIRLVTGDPVISLASPLDGTKWNAGVENEITWDSEFIADVKIELSTDNGQTWSEITESTSANSRSYLWSASGITSDECLIKVSDAANPDVYDISEETFTLCLLDLVNPSGFSFYRVGTPIGILWSGEMIGDVNLYYKIDAGDDWTLIEENIPNTINTIEWIPQEATDWCRVMVRETEYPDVSDESENYFIVFRLDLTSPTGGEELDGWQEFDITWESEIVNGVKIEFSDDNGQSWNLVDGNTPAGSSPYVWTVPNINSTECFIKISVPGLSDLYSVNETPFSIDESVGVIDQDMNSKYNLSISPNPVNDEAIVYFTNPDLSQADVSLEVINSNGDVVYKKSMAKNITGEQRVELKLGDLPTGIYVLNLNIDGVQKSIKFIKGSR